MNRTARLRLAVLGCAALATATLAPVGSAAAGTAAAAGATGSGTVFKVNPVQSSGNQALTDVKDADAAACGPEYATVQLTDLDGSGYLRRCRALGRRWRRAASARRSATTSR